MRWLLLLLLLPCLARADGFAYGKSMRVIRESDQLAVIHLDERQADVNMFIAIDGIPAGETVTYVLPFWYRPDGFTLTEMDNVDFQKQIVSPANSKLIATNRLTAERTSERLANVGLAIALGPAGFPIMMQAREKSRQYSSGTMRPYRVTETAHARAELFRGVQAQDLPALVARAGLPAKYAEPLKRYHTQHFAVMRLTGPKAGEKTGGTGVRYHFRHAIPADQRGTYTYPLGTGAAWAKPILLTEVYLTCPDKYALQVKAPQIGDKLDQYYKFDMNHRNLRFLMSMSPAEQQKLLNDPEERRHPFYSELTASTYTASMLDSKVHHTSSWHIAYLNSNPSQDIAVKLIPRPHAARYAVLRFLSQGSWGYHLPLAFTLFALVAGWWASARFIIRPRWQAVWTPGSLLGRVAYTVIVSYLGFNVLFYITALLISYPPNLFIAIPIAVCIFALVWLIRKQLPSPKKMFTPHWRTLDVIAAWAGAMAVYAVLVGGAYLFLRWCEAAI